MNSDLHPKVVDKNVDFASKVIPGSKGQLKKRKSRLILEQSIEPLIIVAADQSDLGLQIEAAEAAVTSKKTRFLPKQWMYAWRKNRQNRDKKVKKGLFSKVAKVTRVLQAFKVKKAVQTTIADEPTSVHLRPIQSSTSGLVCHFSKVNYPILLTSKYLGCKWNKTNTISVCFCVSQAIILYPWMMNSDSFSSI